MLNKPDSLLSREYLPIGVEPVYAAEDGPVCYMKETNGVLKVKTTRTKSGRVTLPILRQSVYLNDREISPSYSIGKFVGQVLFGIIPSNSIKLEKDSEDPIDLIATIEANDMAFKSFLVGPATESVAKNKIKEFFHRQVYTCESVPEGVLIAVAEPDYAGRIVIIPSQDGICIAAMNPRAVAASLIMESSSIQDRKNKLNTLRKIHLMDSIIET